MFISGGQTWSYSVMLVLTIALLSASEAVNPVVNRFYDLVQAINKSVSYSVANYQYMNFDGVFGLWIAEGYLKYVLTSSSLWQDYLGNEKLMPAKQSLSQIYSSVAKVLPSVIESVKQRDMKYFEKMGTLFQLHWWPQTPNSLSDVGYYADSFVHETTFDEELSDRCISQLLNISNTTNRCQPSVECLELITGPTSHGYELTHQVLYAAIITHLDCTASVNKIMELKGLSFFMRIVSLCSYTYNELISMLNLKTLTSMHRDLLMEQIFVCSHMGFVRFNQLPLLDMILSWQHPSGCFTDDKKSPNASDVRISGRRLSEEKRLPDGCLSHLTSVATAALMTFLRRFLLPATEIIPNEMDIHQILLDGEQLDQYTFLPELLKPPKDSHVVPLNSPWLPSVSEDRLAQLSQLHHLALWRSFPRREIQTGALQLGISEVDWCTNMLFHFVSILSLVLCVVFCLRYRRRLGPGSCDFV